MAEWTNRLYFQMGRLIEDAVTWLGMLHAIAISPQISPPASFPAISRLEQRLVRHALDELEGHFTIKELHQAFGEEISRRRLSALAQAWEARELLTTRPRRGTFALRTLVEGEEDSKREGV